MILMMRPVVVEVTMTQVPISLQEEVA